MAEKPPKPVISQESEEAVQESPPETTGPRGDLETKEVGSGPQEGSSIAEETLEEDRKKIEEERISETKERLGIGKGGHHHAESDRSAAATHREAGVAKISREPVGRYLASSAKGGFFALLDPRNWFTALKLIGSWILMAAKRAPEMAGKGGGGGGHGGDHGGGHGGGGHH